jgi:hypothetical protein
MTTTLIRAAVPSASTHETPSDDPLWQRLLAYRAPFLIDKLLRSGLAEDTAHAELLFLEVKKYLFVASGYDGRMPMTSSLVDAAWHQFILYTTEYREFCQAVFGAYQHHSPRAAADDAPAADETGPVVTARTFVDNYHRQFGLLPDVWHDERCLTDATRLVRPDARTALSAERDASFALLFRARERRELVCRASRRALPAFGFIAAHGAFFVRELPGLRDLGERLALLRPLVECDVLNVAP